MTIEDVSLLLGVLGGTCVLVSWIAHRTGDARRDCWLIFGTGACLSIGGAVGLLFS